MPFTLYYSPGACSLAVHIVLEELEHDFQLSLVSVANGDTSSESYLKINPKGRVPALRMNDHTLTEAPAILMYLGESSPDRNMIPKSAMEKGRSLEWLNWLSTTVHTQGFGQLWRPGRFSDVPEHVSALQAKGRETIVNALGDINAKLQGRHWAVGEHYSVVDPYLLVFYRWGNRIGIPMRERYAAWTKHAEQMLKRPAVQRALKSEGISVWE